MGQGKFIVVKSELRFDPNFSFHLGCSACAHKKLIVRSAVFGDKFR